LAVDANRGCSVTRRRGVAVAARRTAATAAAEPRVYVEVFLGVVKELTAHGGPGITDLGKQRCGGARESQSRRYTSGWCLALAAARRVLRWSADRR
jgi:hypothetical protein